MAGYKIFSGLGTGINNAVSDFYKTKDYLENQNRQNSQQDFTNKLRLQQIEDDKASKQQEMDWRKSQASQAAKMQYEKFLDDAYSTDLSNLPKDRQQAFWEHVNAIEDGLGRKQTPFAYQPPRFNSGMLKDITANPALINMLPVDQIDALRQSAAAGGITGTPAIEGRAATPEQIFNIGGNAIGPSPTELDTLTSPDYRRILGAPGTSGAVGNYTAPATPAVEAQPARTWQENLTQALSQTPKNAREDAKMLNTMSNTFKDLRRQKTDAGQIALAYYRPMRDSGYTGSLDDLTKFINSIGSTTGAQDQTYSVSSGKSIETSRHNKVTETEATRHNKATESISADRSKAQNALGQQRVDIMRQNNALANQNRLDRLAQFNAKQAQFAIKVDNDLAKYEDQLTRTISSGKDSNGNELPEDYQLALGRQLIDVKKRRKGIAAKMNSTPASIKVYLDNAASGDPRIAKARKNGYSDQQIYDELMKGK